MLSSIFVALLQAAAGDPAVPADTPAADTPAAQTDAAPRTERVRVCRTYEASTGGRLSTRRCRWEERPVHDEAPAADAGAAFETTTDDSADAARNTDTGGSPGAASPAAPSPQ